MLTRARVLTSWLVASATLAILPGTASAQAVADFYKGKIIRFVVGYGPGSSYDLYARMIAQFVSKHIPGNPQTVVEQMPGASSLTAMNYVANIAPQDGTAIAVVGAALPFGPLIGEAGARFDAVKLGWLPSPGADVGVLAVWHTVPVNSIADARNFELLLGSNAASGQSSTIGRLMNETLKTKIKLIYGYTGGLSEGLLAMQRGEVHGVPNLTWTVLKGKLDWIRDKKIKMLFYFGGKPVPVMAGLPNARDLIEDSDDRELWDFGMSMLAIGKPYAMGPNVPADRLAAMRKAFMDTFADTELQAAAAKGGVDLAPISAEEVVGMVERSYKAPPALIERFKKIYLVDSK
jgi:tripartite-type tricarboxylate transporter receptor subunit TctC